MNNNMKKTALRNLFNNCLDILRNNETLVGDKALKNLSYLLSLKLLEPQINNIVEFNIPESSDNIHDNRTVKLLTNLRFSNLAKLDESEIADILEKIWNEYLAVNKLTKNIFLIDNGFNFKNKSTYKKLIDKIQTFNFDKIESDILGDVFESVFKDILVGKILGQFFTQPNIKKIMIDLIDPKLFDDGECESIIDPAAGTGGFLVSSIKYLKEQSKVNNIKINWDFLNKNISGREIEPDTFQLAVSNLMISSGHIFTNMELLNSITNPIIKKYDIVLTNPPYGIKLNYSDIKFDLKNDYIPIKTNNSVSLFIQLIIYILKINGRCCIIVPDGEILHGNCSNLSIIREYLMKTCELKEIIYLPQNSFTYTSIKTCILYFIKKEEPKDILNLKINISKLNKETRRIYTFKKEHMTNIVKFYNIDNNKNLLLEVDINSITKNNYSLNYKDYLIDNNVNNKQLEELCSFRNGKQLSKSKFIEGPYPVIGGGLTPVGLHNDFNRDENTILCSSSGTAGYISKYSTKIWASDCFSIKVKDKNILNADFLYYYLKSIQEEIYKLRTGTAQPHIYIKNIETLKIPVISLSEQFEVVKKIENMKLEISKKEEEIKQLNNSISNIAKLINEN